MNKMVEKIVNKYALVSALERLGFKWESHADEDEGREYLFARGNYSGIGMLIYCKPKECKTEVVETDYDVAPCYSKPEPDAVLNCVNIVAERLRELEAKAGELLEIAEKLKEHGFRVERSWSGVIAEKPINNGHITIYFPYNADTNNLKVELKAKSPVKLVIIAAELAELFERL